MLNSTIEDLVLFICDPINHIDSKEIVPRDKSVIFSIRAQLKKPLALTEKQATLLLTILENNKEHYSNVPNYINLINNPIFKYTFRKIDLEKSLTLVEYEGKKFINIKYPFNKKINQAFSNYYGSYKIIGKEKHFYLNEKNIYDTIQIVKDLEFNIDDKLLEWYNEIYDIQSHMENYIPLIDINPNDELFLKNCSNTTVEYFNSHQTNNLISDILLSKRLELTLGNRLVDKIKGLELNPILEKILLDKETCFSLSQKHDWSDLLDSLQQWPISVILNEDKKLNESLDFWHKTFLKIGIKNEEMSILFRSQKNKEFNQTIRDLGINNKVDNQTKVVYTKGKLPKLLYKIDFKPKIVLTPCNYGIFQSHISVNKLVESHPFVIFYTDQELYLTIRGRKIVKL